MPLVYIRKKKVAVADVSQMVGIVCVATGGGAGTWQRIDGNFNAIATNVTFNNHPTYAGIVDQDIDGQSMVKIPKFYLKTGVVPSGPYVGKRFWMISNAAAPGFSVHPAFMNAGTEINQYWVGKYQGTADGTKLGSKAGLMPVISINFPTMQSLAEARNTGGVTGFMLWSIYHLSAIQVLALIEMGGSDSQTLIGRGLVDESRVAALVVDNATAVKASWHGIVGLWGNVYQWVDGLQTDANSKYKIWDKNGNKTYQTTSQTAPMAGYGYPVTMSTATGTDYDLSTIFAPETINADARRGTYADYFYKNPNSGAVCGGYWGEGDVAGLFYLSLIYNPISGHPRVGARLAKV